MAKISRNIDEYVAMSQAEAWNGYNWGLEMKQGHPVYRMESERHAVMLGIDYEDVWWCEVDAESDGRWDMVGQGWGGSAEEAIEMAEDEWNGTAELPSEIVNDAR